MKKLLRSLKRLSLIVTLTLTTALIARATTYYSTGSNAPNSTSSWRTNANGTGSTPNNFNGNNDIFIIQSGHTMTTTNSWGVSGTIQIATGGTLVASNSVTSNHNMTVASGATYQHNQNGGTIPAATWSTGATCLVNGVTNLLPNGLAPSSNFANLTWNCAAQNSSLSLAGGLGDINGDLTIANTGSGSLRLLNGGSGGTLSVGGNFFQTGGSFYVVGSGSNNTSTSMTVTIAGNFSLTGGTLTVNGATTGNSNTAVINVAGDFSHTAGTLTESASSFYTSTIHFNGSGTQTYTSGGTVTNSVNFTVDNGATLQMGTGAAPSVITGGGTFTLSSGATLGVTSPAGITTTGATGNIQVTGTRTFNSSNSTSFIYNGAAAQVTGSGFPANVSNFYITTSNASNVTLTNAVAVGGNLRLISGNIDASSKNLTLNSGSSITGGSASSYVMTGDGVNTTGTVTRSNLTNGQSSLFPVGNSSYYLPVTIVPATSNQSFTVFVFQGATQNGVAGGTPISNKTGIVDAVWNINRTSGGTSNAAITLQWVNALEGSSFANYSASNIGISHYTSGAWQNAAQTAANTTTNTVTNTFNSFSPFGVGTISTPLPVILVGFNAVMNSNKTVGISWSTQQEINSSHFDVMRSADGISWQVIGTVDAKGNSPLVNTYSYIDQSPLNGINYYRLKMVDIDNRYGYTEIKAVRTTATFGISVFPNPAKDFVNVSISKATSDLSIRMINQLGQVMQETKVSNGTTTIVSMPTHNYPQGTYMLQVKGADGTQQTSKVLVIK